MKEYTFTLHIRVQSVADLYLAARDQCLKDGLDDPTDMIGTSSDPDVENCLVVLLDPGQSPPGTEIQESSAVGTWSGAD